VTGAGVDFRCEPAGDPLAALANNFPLRRQLLDSLVRRMQKLDRDERVIWLRVHGEVLARDVARSRRISTRKRTPKGRWT
jgi:hypothetical protein